MDILVFVYCPYKFDIFAKSKLLEEIVVLLFLRGALPQSCSSADILCSSRAEAFSCTPTKSRSVDRHLRGTSARFSSATTVYSSTDISSRSTSSVL